MKTLTSVKPKICAHFSSDPVTKKLVAPLRKESVRRLFLVSQRTGTSYQKIQQKRGANFFAFTRSGKTGLQCREMTGNRVIPPRSDSGS